MAIVEVSIVPIGTHSTGVSEYVRAALEVIRQSGLKHELNPMGTCIEGDLESVFAVIRRMHEALAGMGCARLVTTIKIDDRRDRPGDMQGKVQRVLNPPR
ncbi:MAG: MTH1187 family thiamine-binding protein [candidate division WOR-3 bacterium]